MKELVVNFSTAHDRGHLWNILTWISPGALAIFPILQQVLQFWLWPNSFSFATARRPARRASRSKFYYLTLRFQVSWVGIHQSIMFFNFVFRVYAERSRSSMINQENKRSMYLINHSSSPDFTNLIPIPRYGRSNLNLKSKYQFRLFLGYLFVCLAIRLKDLSLQSYVFKPRRPSANQFYTQSTLLPLLETARWIFYGRSV